MSPPPDTRTHGRGSRAPGSRPQSPTIKVQLAFDLLAHLDGTGIAASFGLREYGAKRHTLVELGRDDAEDLITLLKALVTELRLRAEKWRRHASKSPISYLRRTATEQRLQAIDSAADLIQAALKESKERR
jgi:hypothetical protein